MSYPKIVTDGFVRDENGKWNIVPLKLPGGSSAKKSSEKKKERKFIPIERIPTANLHSSPQNEPKRRKIEEPVRKELFKDPPRRSRISSRLSINTRQSKNFKFTKPSKSFRISPATKRETSKPCILPLSDGSPLLDIDEAEELLMKLPVKSPTIIPSLIISSKVRDTPEKQVINEQNGVTPSSNESVNEFIEIEKNLTELIEVDNKTDSPMSTVCNLLQHAKIKNSGGKHKQNGPILKEINNLFEKSKSEFYNLKQQITAYNNLQEENFKKIADLLKQLESGKCDKENSTTRRSNRIAAQVTITKEKTKFVVSPAISKKIDLRKSTLNNNLTKTLQTDTQSPRMRRAVDMYNTIRSDYSVLCTPKLDRTAMDVQQSSVTRSLSRRLQKQCLLLQDTPKPTEY